MATVFDYLDWRGDLGFDLSDFNEADALVFAWLSYYEFENLQGANNKTIAEIVQLHVAQYGEFQKINVNSTIIPQTSATWLLYCVSRTARFSGVVVNRAEGVKDLAANVQFGAVSFTYRPGKVCIAYRGTDESVAGWKEDCMLSYAKHLPAQRYALSFLENENAAVPKIIVGHSKGGNLAMYSALHCEESVLNTISRIYNFDGPGFFNDDMLDTDRYREILKTKIITIVPKSSIIGMLLNHEDDYLIVDSEMVSMLQHNALYWKIKGTTFEYLDKRTTSSQIIDKTVTQWIDSLSLEKRETIVNNLFGVIENTGVTDFTQLANNLPKNAVLIVKGLTQVPKEDRDMIAGVLFKLAGISTSNITQAIVNNNIVNDISNDIEGTVSSLADTLQQGKNKLFQAVRQKKASLFGGSNKDSKR